MPIFALFALLYLVALLIPADAWAKAGTALVERQWRHVVVEDDGSHLLSQERVLLIATSGDARHFARQRIGYRPANDELVSLEAYTEKPDGQRIKVLPAAITTATIKDGPDFGNTHEAIIVFPAVEAGDRLVLQHVMRRHTPLLAGHFDDLVSDEGLEQRDLRVTYDVPATWSLAADAIGFAPLAASSPPGKRRYAWQYAASAPSVLETGAVSLLDHGNRLAVSSTPDHAAFAGIVQQMMNKLIQQLREAAAVPTAPQGRHGPGKTALAARVQQLQRMLDEGSAPAGVPAALRLAALLANDGIEYEVALANFGNAYALLEVPSLALFNHVLVYQPQLARYLDPASRSPVAGQLPLPLLGKPALHVDPPGFAMVPFFQPQRLQARALLAPAAEGKPVERLLPANGTQGQGVAAALAPLNALAQRQNDFACPPVDASDEVRVQLAPGMRLLALPGPVDVADINLAYRARYQRRGQEVKVLRSFVFRHTGPTCTAQDLARMQPALQKIARELRTELVIKRGSPPVKPYAAASSPHQASLHKRGE